MSIYFSATDHTYKSLETEDKVNWISVTTLVAHFKKPFDAKSIAAKVSKNKRSKWFGIDPKKIQEIWETESERAVTMGTYYHNQREADLCALSSLEVDGKNIPIFIPNETTESGIKLAPSQKLEEGVYPEHMVYLKSAGICGQSDLVEVVNGKINIIDYKGLALDTPIPTIKGFKFIKDIQIGDIIYDGNGKPTKVEHVSEIHHNPCYKIKFNTNDELICDHEHKWLITERITKGVYNTKSYTVSYIEKEYTTEQLLHKKNKNEILRISCTSIENKFKELPLDPYVLGLWLGDGSKQCGALTNMNNDTWLEIERRGYVLGKDISKGGCGKAQTKTILDIYPILKKLNLIDNKHLPELYLTASYTQRLDLLRGLMDSDGHYNSKRKSCVVNTTQKWQAEAVVQIASSLGIKATLHYTYTTYNKIKKPAYHATFRIDTFSPFLTRNKDIHLDMKSFNKYTRDSYRLIKSIELIPTVATKCLSVKSKTHSYLAGKNYIKTHNTNKEIKKESFVNWEGASDKLQFPLDGLDDCNFNHYAIQLSIYMYIMLKHNPKLKPGKMFIHHVVFEVESEDEYGYPVIKLDHNGDPVIKDVIPMVIPYLVDEVNALMHYIKDNKIVIKKK
jgi:hypothetical protein